MTSFPFYFSYLELLSSFWPLTFAFIYLFLAQPDDIKLRRAFQWWRFEPWASHLCGDIWAKFLIIAWQGHLLGEGRKQLQRGDEAMQAAQKQSLGFTLQSKF